MAFLSDRELRRAAPAATDFASGAITAEPGVTRRAGLIPVTKPKRREQLTGYLTIAPAFILILGLTLYPVAYSIWLSLLEKHSFFPQQRFIGLENYLYLWSDPEFWSAFWLGLVYSF